MTFSVRVLARARADVEAIVQWIAVERQAPEGAERWLDAYEAALADLVANPYRYGLAPENRVSDHELRQFLFKTRRGRTYRGVFVVIGDEVRVLRIRGPGQPPLSVDELDSLS